MPDLDDMGAVSEAAAVSHRTATAAAPPSRRSVLRVAAGAGAAGIAASTLGSVVGGVAARASTMAGQHAGHAPGAAAAAEPLVLHVRDAASGEIDIFHGTTLTRVRDKDLAARIVSASR
jgi:hypothetical protein